MCGKMGKNEVDSMKNMMTLAVYYVVADVFDVDAMDLDVTTDFYKDLHSSQAMQNKLYESVSDMFNGLKLDGMHSHTVQDIVDQVVSIEENVTVH